MARQLFERCATGCLLPHAQHPLHACPVLAGRRTLKCTCSAAAAPRSHVHRCCKGAGACHDWKLANEDLQQQEAAKRRGVRAHARTRTQRLPPRCRHSDVAAGLALLAGTTP